MQWFSNPLEFYSLLQDFLTRQIIILLSPQSIGWIWLDISSLIFSLFISSNIFKSYAALFLLNWLVLLFWIWNQQINVLVQNILWCPTNINIHTISARFLLRRWATASVIIRGMINFRLRSIVWEISKILSIIFLCYLTEGLFVEWDFSKVLPNL